MRVNLTGQYHARANGNDTFCTQQTVAILTPTTSQVRRTHEGVTGKVLYDIDFDDGDKEEGVLSGRVRSPGQTPPALQAGLVVDVKLARKGKVTTAPQIGAVMYVRVKTRHTPGTAHHSGRVLVPGP